MKLWYTMFITTFLMVYGTLSIVLSIPTLLFFRDGRVVDQVIGVVPKKVLADKLNTMLQPA